MSPDTWTTQLTSVRTTTIPLVREESIPPAILAVVSAKDYPILKENHPVFLNLHELGHYRSLSEQKKTGYLLSRYAAKRALGEYLAEEDPQKIEVSTSVMHQPFVRHDSHRAPDVSLTQTNGLGAALAFPKAHPMGLDLERCDPERLEDLRYNVAHREWKAVPAELGPEHVRSSLILAGKTALSKCLKCGLSTPFTIFEVDGVTVEDGAVTGTYKNFTQYRFYAWLGHGYAFAIIFPKNTRLGIPVSQVGDFLQEVFQPAGGKDSAG